ncbi:rho GTPase-activating protein 12 isoform X9 [Spea bombifrons]|uniref:rho GTPase-activating protein 12 isoform X9 n=1 Tax=Spea bombifrons TaxID=233779 RepID=UPI0023498471|nr:rho GTPase-activating protein 12 isoform X9 [Spea bombifrons]
MADKSGKPLPGPAFVEVEYDYEYEYKGKKIVIKQGEKYILMKKSNEDWWQVKKEENARPLYVPAQYVKEVGRKALMPPVKQAVLPNSPLKVMQGLQRSTENINKSPELSSFGKSSSFRDANQNIGPSSSPGQARGLTLDLVHNNGKLSGDLHSPKASSRSPSALHFPGPDMMDVEKTGFTNDCSGDSAGESSERIPLDSESGDELSSSSTEQLQWIKHVDEQGRPYYYSADGLRSEWELPKYNALLQPQREITKSRSLDRKLQEPIVLTKWRHSTYLLDSNDKSRFKQKRNSSAYAVPNPGYLIPPYSEKDSTTASKPIFPDIETSPSSPKHLSTDQEKYGVLNVTKITENGKKLRQNWTSSWAVLQSSSLLLQTTGASWSLCSRCSIPVLLLSLLSAWNKPSHCWPAVTSVNPGPVSPVSKFGGNQSKPEFTVDLKGASLEWAGKDKSSKKNVLELKTHTGTDLLLQSDNDGLIKEWYTALCNTIGIPVGEPDEASEENVPDSPVEKHGKEKHDKEKEHDRDSKKNRSIKPSGSIDNSEQKKTKTKLKKFLTRRPTLQAVREKGYIKDPVFGSSLASLCQRENTAVPNFVKLCIDHVEEHGLQVDGLYRVSGNLAVIQKLRFAVTHDEKLDLNDSKWEDIHVITGALKMFFRELPEPLFTYNYFNDFVDAIKQEPKLRVQAVKDLIKQLPKPNQDTMQALFKHLKHVVETGGKNRMTYQSLAIVFGPTLLKPEKETGNIAIHTVYQNQIVELILLEYNTIFGRRDQP